MYMVIRTIIQPNKKCPFRKNCIKYKTGKARNYHKRLGKEFKETRAEFIPNPQDITVYKTCNWN